VDWRADTAAVANAMPPKTMAPSKLSVAVCSQPNMSERPEETTGND